MAGNSTTARRAQFFDCLNEEGEFSLTAITRVSWTQAERVDKILFHLADNLDRAKTCRLFGLGREELDSLLAEAGEDELSRIP